MTMRLLERFFPGSIAGHCIHPTLLPRFESYGRDADNYRRPCMRALRWIGIGILSLAGLLLVATIAIYIASSIRIHKDIPDRG